MRALGELKDPVQEALRRMIAEFHDYHYHTCPAEENDDAPCKCFAGALIVQSLATLRKASGLRGDRSADDANSVVR